jgi:hypothetical protein
LLSIPGDLKSDQVWLAELRRGDCPPAADLTHKAGDSNFLPSLRRATPFASTI